jgi:hypothetical protein
MKISIFCAAAIFLAFEHHDECGFASVHIQQELSGIPRGI